MKSNIIVQAFGIPNASPLEVSRELASLRISHSIHGLLQGQSNGYASVPSAGIIKHIASTQPYWVSVVNRVNALRKPLPNKPQIIFVCDAFARLQTCNVGIFNWEDLRESLIGALQKAVDSPIKNGWKLIENTPTIEDYIKVATKPSYLNKIQDLLYKIVPYDLRKKTQIHIIAYLAGAVSRASLMSHLSSSFKLDLLKQQLKHPKAAELREAVALYAKTLDIEATSKATGFETFEILYIFSSSKKSIADLKAKK